ncbi:MAG: hypothetical protein AMJ69_02780 [Gammaproteobacteria bacterium SG8_47]|nr:MAG: hypothetical protein AMJ69_02780 [Gammaproteobacteria bacterium SG8_47]
MAAVTFRHVSKSFADGTRALVDLNVDIEDGEFMVLVGPSGCGKSTTLRLLAGLEAATEGDILIGNQIVNDKPPQRRQVAMVFQNYALYPHMTVRKNLAFPLRMKKLPRHEVERRVAEAARVLELTDLLDRKPKQISGGQRQRVAMGRAIVRDPQVFLMDEPLSNLDARLRVQIRNDIAVLQRKMGTTTVYVTHDQVEAMTLGDRVAVMNEGRLQQLAAPQVLYNRPANTFVAGFIGTPGMNLIAGRVIEERAGLSVEVGGYALRLAEPALVGHGELRRNREEITTIGVRPEAVSLSGEGGEGLPAQITSVETLGHEQLVYFTAPWAREQTLVARVRGAGDLLTGAASLRIDKSMLYFFTSTGEAVY